MHILKGALSFFLITVIFCACDTEYEIDETVSVFETPQLKVASFNIRFDNPADGINSWDNRREHVLSYLRLEELDIIGMQEALNSQVLYLENNLPNYTRVGVGREDGDSQGEYAPIFFDRERFALLQSGTFWLSTTPDEPSVGWDAVLERICTFAYLRDTLSGEIVHVYNAHYDHVGATARLESSALIADYIRENSEGTRVIFMGDLNAEPSSGPYSLIESAGLEDSYNSEINFGPQGTWNGFNTGGTYLRRIDYVFSSGFRSVFYKADDVTINGNFLSDHFPVIAVLEYRPL